MEKIYTVVNIYRNFGPALIFTISLYSDIHEYFQVNKDMSDEISRGLVLIGDSIVITERSDDGIKFKVVESPDPAVLVSENESLLYKDKSTIKYLPFLCDVFSYCKLNKLDIVSATAIYEDKRFIGKYLIDGNEISNLKIPIPRQFVAKIHQKTRINMYPNSYNPFFFIIASSNNILIKIVFWRESLKTYSSLNVGDVIYVKEFKHKKKLPFIDIMEYNTFTESVYFDCEEITARDISQISLNKQGTVKYLFDIVEGYISYCSILKRYKCNGSLMEYILIIVDDKRVVLFYNSDDEFSKIEDGKIIKITELRKVERAGVEFYVSTIYTQFKLVEFCDNNTDINTDTCNTDINTDTNADTNNTVNITINLPPVNPEISGVSTKRQIADDSENIKKSKISNSKINHIFGAMGFIPDNFNSLKDIIDFNASENIQSRESSINLFMKPMVTSIDDMQNYLDSSKQGIYSLVLNESKKHIIHSTFVAYENDFLTIDYFENGLEKKQEARKLVLEHGFCCYAFDNYFTNEINLGNLERFVGQKIYFIIEAFRADLDTILYILTGICEK